jgi:hypothetical protein
VSSETVNGQLVPFLGDMYKVYVCDAQSTRNRNVFLEALVQTFTRSASRDESASGTTLAVARSACVYCLVVALSSVCTVLRLTVWGVDDAVCRAGAMGGVRPGGGVGAALSAKDSRAASILEAAQRARARNGVASTPAMKTPATAGRKAAGGDDDSQLLHYIADTLCVLPYGKEEEVLVVIFHVNRVLSLHIG